jgi:hypothetical protein
MNPAAAFSPAGSYFGADMSPGAAFSDSDDQSDFEADRAVSPLPTLIPGPFTAASFGPIAEEDLESSDPE